MPAQVQSSVDDLRFCRDQCGRVPSAGQVLSPTAASWWLRHRPDLRSRI